MSKSKTGSKLPSMATKKPPTQVPPLSLNVKAAAKTATNRRNSKDRSGANSGMKINPKQLKSLNGKSTNPTRSIAKDTKVLPDISSATDKFHAMLQGNLDNLPAKPPSEVRIFLSSTFSDLRCERNWLYKDAYNRLKQFCAERDLEFDMLDMRWGVTDDATNEHITERLCIQEVRNCQKVSLGPNFVAILGDKYGYRPVPSEVGAAEFESLLSQLQDHPQLKLLTNWYRLDENALNPVYILQPIKSRLPHFADATPGKEEHRKADTAAWWQTFKILQGLFREAATSAHEKGLITAEQQLAYFRSVTECEVDAGISQAYHSAAHALCYIRRLSGLDKSTLSERNAPRYIDTTVLAGQEVLDEEVAILRRDLSDKKLPVSLASVNMRRFEVTWRDGGLDPVACEEHRTYLNDFCEKFIFDVQRLIEGGLHAKQTHIPASEYYTDYEELLHHLHFTNSKCESFRGRQELLDGVCSYIKRKKRKPLVLYAESGAGKTSVMARLMKVLPEMFGSDCIRVVRYLGTSALSTDIFNVLFGIVGQLSDTLGNLLEPQGYRTFASLKEYFPRCLRQLARGKCAGRQIFILLDSLDQLSPAEGAHTMNWLPLELPANVHVILSTLPRLHGCLNRLQTLLSDPECFMEVPTLPETVGLEIVDAYLSNKQRRITAEQMEPIKAQLHAQPTPLLIKILLDQALQWKSYTLVDPASLASTVQEAIQKLYQSLEERFGNTLVQKALGYLTCGLNGLTEVELEDLLSCDDLVLQEVYQYHDPPIEGIIRIPPLLWARIKQDIVEYLSERKSFNKTTMYWYHRQFIEGAEDRYTRGETGLALHATMAEFYLADEGVQRSITLPKRKGLTIENADRQVSQKPMSARNHRKLKAVLHHLSKSANWSRLKEAALCNLRFLMTSMYAFSVDSVLRDVRSVMEEITQDDPEGSSDLELLYSCLNVPRPDRLPLQLVGQLSVRDSSSIQQLRQQAISYLERSTTPCLLPLYACLAKEVIGEVQQDSTISHLSQCQDIKHLTFLPDSGNICTVSESDTLAVWDISSLEIVVSTPAQCAIDEMRALPGDHVLLRSHDGTLRLWHPESSSAGIVLVDLGGHVMLCCLDAQMLCVYALVKDQNKTYLKKYDCKQQTVTSTWDIKGNMVIENATMKVTNDKKYVVVFNECQPKELEIINKTSAKNNLPKSEGCTHKLVSLNLSKKTCTWRTCHRFLTKIPMLGACWELLEPNSVLIGRLRITVVWDLENDKCDQHLVKGTKIPKFFRPHWLENDDNWGTVCHGATWCAHQSSHGGDVLALGSEDGFMMLYNTEDGRCLQKNLNPKKPQHSAKVEQVVVSPRGRWVASVCANGVLKVWSVGGNNPEITSLQVDGQVVALTFSPQDTHLTAQLRREDGVGRVLLFRVLPGTGVGG